MNIKLLLCDDFLFDQKWLDGRYLGWNFKTQKPW